MCGTAIGVLRLRGKFATRTFYSAQDDSSRGYVQLALRAGYCTSTDTRSPSAFPRLYSLQSRPGPPTRRRTRPLPPAAMICSRRCAISCSSACPDGQNRRWTLSAIHSQQFPSDELDFAAVWRGLREFLLHRNSQSCRVSAVSRTAGTACCLGQHTILLQRGQVCQTLPGGLRDFRV